MRLALGLSLAVLASPALGDGAPGFRLAILPSTPCEAVREAAAREGHLQALSPTRFDWALRRLGERADLLAELEQERARADAQAALALAYRDLAREHQDRADRAEARLALKLAEVPALALPERRRGRWATRLGFFAAGVAAGALAD